MVRGREVFAGATAFLRSITPIVIAACVGPDAGVVVAAVALGAGAATSSAAVAVAVALVGAGAGTAVAFAVGSGIACRSDDGAGVVCVADVDAAAGSRRSPTTRPPMQSSTAPPTEATTLRDARRGTPCGLVLSAESVSMMGSSACVFQRARRAVARIGRRQVDGRHRFAHRGPLEAAAQHGAVALHLFVGVVARRGQRFAEERRATTSAVTRRLHSSSAASIAVRISAAVAQRASGSGSSALWITSAIGFGTSVTNAGGGLCVHQLEEAREIVVSVVRRMSFDQIEGDGADRPDVGAAIDGPRHRLLRRHVPELALRVSVGRVGGEAIVGLRHAEVDQLHHPLVADEDVLRGDVAMDDTQRFPIAFELVSGMQAGARIREHAHDDPHRDRLAGALHHVAEDVERTSR